ncbi:MAG: alpha-galactosidase [Clostridiales bacterium]|nr:alpha-galactosidase [Clostridiales bacterium]
MIAFDEKQRIFKIDTRQSSYIIGIYRENYLLNLYYGAKIPDTNLWQRAKRSKSASFSPSNPNFDNEDFSTDVAPMEYSCNGSGDFGVSAFSVRNSDGNSVTDLRYVSHKIYKGKPDLGAMPCTYAAADEADTLEITTVDKVTGVEAVLIYTAFTKNGAIARSVKVTNKGKNPVDIERVFSACVDLPSADFDMITLYGRHAKERCVEKRPLGRGVQGIFSKRGVSGHSENPFAALTEKNADEDKGGVYGVNLVYSGNFEICAECDYSGTTRLIAGINPTDFLWHLEPEESFQTPEAVLVYTDKGLGEMSRIFHRLYLNNLIRGRYKSEKRPLLINNWEATSFDFDADKLVSFAERAKELGMDMLVMDDGWFGKRNDDTSSLGDWYVNEEKLPGGLGALIKRVNDLGLKFGIWFEPEMISPDSELYRAHPDWCVHVPNRDKSISRHQYVLDVSREDVRENIWAQMYHILSNYNIEYVKWDFNRNISEAGSAVLPPSRQKEFFHRFIMGTYDLMNRLTSTFPDILVENCSGGGGRFDPAMLCYSPQIWASDNTDPIERLTIQFGTSLCYPASTMGAHVSASRRTGYETKGNVALWGTFGYELDPNKLTEDEKTLVKEQVKEYHKYYDLIHYGDLYRLICPEENAYKCAWSFVSPDKNQALVTIVTMREDIGLLHILKLKGLDPDKFYTDEASGEVYSGGLLMNAGLNVSRMAEKTGESVKIFLTAN